MIKNGTITIAETTHTHPGTGNREGVRLLAADALEDAYKYVVYDFEFNASKATEKRAYCAYFSTQASAVQSYIRRAANSNKKAILTENLSVGYKRLKGRLS